MALGGRRGVALGGRRGVALGGMRGVALSSRRGVVFGGSVVVEGSELDMKMTREPEQRFAMSQQLHCSRTAQGITIHLQNTHTGGDTGREGGRGGGGGEGGEGGREGREGGRGGREGRDGGILHCDSYVLL